MSRRLLPPTYRIALPLSPETLAATRGTRPVASVHQDVVELPTECIINAFHDIRRIVQRGIRKAEESDYRLLPYYVVQHELSQEYKDLFL